MKFRNLLFAVSSLSMSAMSADLTWDANTTTTGAQDGAGAWNTGNTSWWNGTSNVSFAGGDNVTFGAASGAAGTITVDAGGVTAGTLTFNAAGSGSYTFSGGSITGGALVKNGANGVRFDNANSFTSVTVNAGANSQSDGALRLGNANALGTAPITFANTADMTGLYFLTGFGNATTFSNDIAFTGSASRITRLLLTSNTSSGPQMVTFSGLLTGGVSSSKIRTDGTVASGESIVKLTNSGNTVTASEWEIWRGALEITSDAALGNVNNAIRLNVGATSDPVGTGLRFGADNITLAATRNVIIQDRTNINTLNYTGSQINGAVTFTNTIVKKGTTTLTLNGSASGTGGIRIDEGTVRIGTGGTTGAAGTGEIALQSASTGLVIDRSNAITLSNAITGTGTLTKSAAGTATLSGTNTFSGGTTIGGGRIAISSAANIGTGDIAFTTVGTGLEITGTAVTLANNITLPTSGTGNITLLTANNSSTVINGNISGGGSGTVLFFQGGAQSQNTGALTLNGNNTLTGTINIQRGPLILGNANAAGSATILIDSNNAPAGALQFGNSFTLNNSITMQYFASSPSQRLGVGSGLSGVIGGVISSAGGAAGIDKVGTGTLTLTNTNTYTGQTVISGGTLALSGSGSIATSPSIIVGASTTFDVSGVTGGYTLGASQTLSGTGAVTGNLTVGGTVAPGNSPGDLTFNDNLGLGGTLNLEVTGITSGLFDRLLGDGSNTLTLGGVLNLNNTGYTATLGDEITVFSGWGSISGSFSSITGTDLGGGLTWDTGSLATSGKLTVIPEPAVAMLGGFGLLALLRRRRTDMK